jgi:photosystem II stability/assembly factor-like uncharacterized protein
MKNYLSTIILFFLFSLPSFGQWSTITSPTANQLSAISFISPDTGYTGGLGGKVYKTTDGGNSWETLSIGNTENIFSIVFTSNLNGNLCTGSNSWGNIYNTKDGGKTWKVKGNVTRYLLDMHFVDDKVGYCVGYSGKILKTTDGGQNWVLQTSNTTEDLRAVYFVDIDTGYIAAAQHEILRTTDGGATWNSFTRKTKAILLGIHFTSARTGFAVGGSGLILKTTDGGISWNQYTNSVTETYQFVMFSDSLVGYAVGEAGILSTTVDGGKHWHSQKFGDFLGRYGWYGIDMIEGITYASGYEGKVARNTCWPSGGNDAQVSCGPFTWVDGKTYSESTNAAQFTLTNDQGCDSFVTLDLTVTNLDLGITISGSTATSKQTSSAYQWIDCDDGSKPLNGETNQSFTPSKSGNYAVIVTKNNCSDTSNCSQVVVLSSIEPSTIFDVSVFPNPSNGSITIDFGKNYHSKSYQIFNAYGQLLGEEYNITSGIVEVTLNEPVGVYWIKIGIDGKQQLLKVLRN